jgi:hypothetical protein
VITLDFVMGLPVSCDFDAILVVVDKLTKYGIFIPTQKTIDAPGTARLLFRHVVKWFGLPRELVSDRDPRFVSEFWKTLAAAFETRLALSSAHHPQTDGQTEVMNQHLETMMRAYVQSDPTEWSNWLDVLQFAYNNSNHSSHGEAPAQLLMGYTPRAPADFITEEALNIERISLSATERIRLLQAHRTAARDTIQRSRDKQAFQYDKSRRMFLFEAGDLVLINPFKLNLLESRGIGTKLRQRRLGPFEVLERVSPTAYQLHLPDTYPMHNVVNVEHLSRYQPLNDKDRPKLDNPRELIKASTEEYDVDRIVEEKREKGKHGKRLYRIRWKGYDAEDDTWQTEQDLRNAPEVLRAWRTRGAAQIRLRPLYGNCVE